MKEHFTKYLHLQNLLRATKPKHVLECGALDGENTANLLSLMPEIGYKLTVLSDDLDLMATNENVTCIQGVSYLEFPKLQDASIDFCIIDTDHNYWTLQKELLALHPKLTDNALIVIHDVETFYYDTGLAEDYGNGVEYPAKEIEETGLKAGGLGTALLDFLSTNRFSYRLVRWLPEGNGCAVIRKNPKEFQIVCMKAMPGKGKRKEFSHA